MRVNLNAKFDQDSDVLHRPGRQTIGLKLVPMAEAAATYSDLISPWPGARTEAQLDSVALRLSKLVPLYAVSAGGNDATPLDKEELEGRQFRRGGAELILKDGRVIRGIATTADALEAAMGLNGIL